MAKSGDTLTNPDGEYLRFLQTSTETGGELLEMEVTYVPHSETPPEHCHPNQEETFRVLSGTFVAALDGVEHTYEVGDTFVVPPGTMHWMNNVSDEEGKLSWQVRPALDTESFFETMWGFANATQNDEGEPPGLLQIALTLHEFRKEFRPAKPSYVMQRIVYGILAPIARMRGYRARYEPSGSAE